MEDIYPIMLGNARIGEAYVTTIGLYYHIRCNCCLSGEAVYRVCVQAGDFCENLGVLVPEGSCFIASTRVPIRKFGSQRLSFYATPKHTVLTGNFIPIHPEEPFGYISRLERAYLSRRADGWYAKLIDEADQSASVG